MTPTRRCSPLHWEQTVINKYRVAIVMTGPSGHSWKTEKGDIIKLVMRLPKRDHTSRILMVDEQPHLEMIAHRDGPTSLGARDFELHQTDWHIAEYDEEYIDNFVYQGAEWHMYETEMSPGADSE